MLAQKGGQEVTLMFDVATKGRGEGSGTPTELNRLRRSSSRFLGFITKRDERRRQK